MGKSLGDEMRELKEEYQRFVAGLPPHVAADPIPYEWWLEIEVLNLRKARQIMTTAQVEYEFDLAVGSAKKAAQRGQVPAQKVGHTWIILRDDAKRCWGWRVNANNTQ